jgi:thiol-disulfide isomerase/thioredoxin
MTGLRTDEELSAFITSSKPGTAVVEYGTTWCVKCHEMFPQFFALSKKVSKQLHVCSSSCKVCSQCMLQHMGVPGVA